MNHETNIRVRDLTEELSEGPWTTLVTSIVVTLGVVMLIAATYNGGF